MAEKLCIKYGGGGSTIHSLSTVEIGRKSGSGDITGLNLNDYIGLCAVQTWSGVIVAPGLRTFITMDDFKAGNTFRSADGGNNGGSYYDTMAYIDNTTIRCTVTAPMNPGNVGVVIYGIKPE